MPAPQSLVDVIDSQWPRGGSRERTISQIINDLLDKEIVTGAGAAGVLAVAFDQAWPVRPRLDSSLIEAPKRDRSTIVRAVADAVDLAGLKWAKPTPTR